MILNYTIAIRSVYYGSRMTCIEKLWKQELYVEAADVFIWNTIGMPWWSLLGIY